MIQAERERLAKSVHNVRAVWSQASPLYAGLAHKALASFFANIEHDARVRAYDRYTPPTTAHGRFAWQVIDRRRSRR